MRSTHCSTSFFLYCTSLSISAEAEKETVESSLELAFPPKLQKSLSRLYHLRRGHLISPGPMSSMDDRAEIRDLFLRFPLEDCLRMMEPSLWSTGSLDGVSSAWEVMQPFPAETLGLWESVSGTDIFLGLWQPRDTDRCIYLFVEHCGSGFPRRVVRMDRRKLHSCAIR